MTKVHFENILSHSTFMTDLTIEIQNFLSSCQSTFSSGQATEHSYRPALQKLLQNFEGVEALNEPKRQQVGAPDFMLRRGSVPIGFLEAKDIDKDLSSKEFKDQLKRYQALGNLCFTNNLHWQFYNGGKLIAETNIALLRSGRLVINNEEINRLAALLEQFVKTQTQTITSSEQLAKIMAAKARTMKDILCKILKGDSKDFEQNDHKSGLFAKYQAFQKHLIHDLTTDKFADLYAQTITYGLFSARYYDTTPESFTRIKAASILPKSNPFLMRLFQQFGTFELDERLDWIVDNLVEAFAHTNVRELMRSFGTEIDTLGFENSLNPAPTLKKFRDPVLHFYQDFLKEYDPKTRKAAGVYYTPDSIVKFIVDSVDEILKRDFSLPKGLSDNSKIERPISKQDATNKSDIITKVKANNHKEHFEQFHKVQILDPATGTGTFLLEVLRNIYTSFESNLGLWPAYAKTDLLPRLHGFELLMAPYAMAHLKLSMFLAETGVNFQDRFSIYLTNSLEEPENNTQDLFSLFLTEESEQASKIKSQTPVMVVLGNPPYNIKSKNKGKWITDIMRDYKKGVKGNIQPLSDDYIKFIRMGQYFMHKQESGILAYITNNSFLDGVIHRQMRKELLKEFDTIYVVNLHGNSKKNERSPDGSKDENVFDIQQGVSINIFVKTSKKVSDQLAKVYYQDLYGPQKHKYQILTHTNIFNLGLIKIKPDNNYHFFVPKNFSLQEEYDQMIKITELFKDFGSGVKSRKDNLLIQKTQAEIIRMLNDVANMDSENLLTKYTLSETSDWKLNNKRKHFLDYLELDVRQIYYRPFDTRWIYYPFNKVNEIIPRGDARRPLMKHFFSPNLGLVLMKGLVNTEELTTVNITKDIININFYGFQTYSFPLYTLTHSGYSESTFEPNFNPDIIVKIEEQLSMKLDNQARIEKSYLSEQSERFAPVDLLDYIYAVLHSPKYRQRYKEFLKIDFPRVAFDVSRKEFWRLVGLGNRLRRLHLLEDEILGTSKVTFPEIGSNQITKFEWQANESRVYINNNQYFGNVDESEWTFCIGGYQPARKWLKDRKDRVLEYADIIHYQKMLQALAETGRLMQEIDVN